MIVDKGLSSHAPAWHKSISTGAERRDGGLDPVRAAVTHV